MYTLKKFTKPFLKGPNYLGQLTGRLPKFCTGGWDWDLMPFVVSNKHWQESRQPRSAIQL